VSFVPPLLQSVRTWTLWHTAPWCSGSSSAAGRISDKCAARRVRATDLWPLNPWAPPTASSSEECETWLGTPPPIPPPPSDWHLVHSRLLKRGPPPPSRDSRAEPGPHKKKKKRHLGWVYTFHWREGCWKRERHRERERERDFPPSSVSLLFRCYSIFLVCSTLVDLKVFVCLIHFCKEETCSPISLSAHEEEYLKPKTGFGFVASPSVVSTPRSRGDDVIESSPAFHLTFDLHAGVRGLECRRVRRLWKPSRRRLAIVYLCVFSSWSGDVRGGARRDERSTFKQELLFPRVVWKSSGAVTALLSLVFLLPHVTASGFQSRVGHGCRAETGPGRIYTPHEYLMDSPRS